jgi:hypothetical protein
MVFPRFRLARTALVASFCIAACTSCSQLTGLDRLTKAKCLDSCDGGESANDATRPNGPLDAASAADRTAFDVGADIAAGGDDVRFIEESTDAPALADSHEDRSSAGAGDGEAGPQDSAAGRQSSDASDATVTDARGNDAEAAADATGDAATCPNGIGSLSNVGTRDFHVSFRIVATQTGWVALVNQRSACLYGFFWDIRQCAPGKDGCPAADVLFVETDNGDSASHQSLFSTGTVNDGKPHDVVLVRAAGMLTIRIDSTPSGAIASVASFGNAMPPVEIGQDPCIGDPTVALTGTLSNLCITSP